MKVNLLTLMTGKLFWSEYLGNGCYGDEIRLERSILAYFADILEYWGSKMDAEKICIAMETYRLTW